MNDIKLFFSSKSIKIDFQGGSSKTMGLHPLTILTRRIINSYWKVYQPPPPPPTAPLGHFINFFAVVLVSEEPETNASEISLCGGEEEIL